MTITDMAKLPVGGLVGGYLLLWATMPFLQEALVLINAWGFDYITGLSWGKWDRGLDRRTGDGRQVGVGYWFRGAHELVLVAKKPGVPSIRTTEPSMFLAPRHGHSQKPELLHELVEAHFPHPYLELFARQIRDGWRVVGDQVPEQPEKVEGFAAQLGFGQQTLNKDLESTLNNLPGPRGIRKREPELE